MRKQFKRALANLAIQSEVKEVKEYISLVEEALLDEEEVNPKNVLSTIWIKENEAGRVRVEEAQAVILGGNQ